MEEEVLKYLDFEGLSLYHQNIQTEFDQKVDKVDFYNDEKIIASALNDLNTRKVNNDDLANVATSGNYNDLNNKPTKVSEFTNDAGYVTELDISGKADQSDLEDLEEEVINNEEVIANALSILSDRIEDNEKVTASALTDLLEKKYEKPSGGIPSSDLAQAVQNLLTAAGTALQASDLNTLNSKVQTLETYFSNEADTDTIINKWNEIVAFLSGITESQTLDGILSNISGQIASKADANYATDSDILALFDSTATQPDANKLVRIGQLSTFLNKIKEIIEDNEEITATAINDINDKIGDIETLLSQI